MTGMKYILSVVLAVIMVMLIVTLVSEGVMSDGEAVATRVEGTVKVIAGGSTEGRAIKNSDTIAKNDRVEVQEGGRLELRMPDGGYLRLSGKTVLTLRKLQFERRTGTVYAQAFLHNGRLWAKMKKRATPNSVVEVATKTGVVTAKETVCGVDAQDDAGTTVTVYEGEVLAAVAGAPADVQPAAVQALQQAVIAAPGPAVQPRDLALRSAINDWSRWNLQRDAREDLASITLTPVSSTITRGHSVQFAAVAHYPDKTEKDITSFATWSSSDANVAKLDDAAVAAGAQLGTATISAAIEDMNGSTLLTVSRDILSIKVTPASRSIVNGAAQQFTAIGTFSDRTVKDITSTAVWTSSNTNIAVVDASGRAVGGNTPGTAVISASLGSKRGSVTLKVRRELMSIAIMPATATVMIGEVQRFGAIGHYSDRTTEDLTEAVLWETSDPGVAEVDQAQPGRVIGKNRTGNATISATFQKRSGSGTITIYELKAP